ncbi:MAG: I78 family peptidase inhibitor [Pseudomonadota bacterium]
MRPAFFLFLLLLVAACAPQTASISPVSPGPGGEDLAACGADRYQTLVGQTHEDLLKTRILGPVRVIRPGTAVTMDFIATRLNIFLDDTDTVTRVSCG